MNIIVTGASRGIGYETVKILAADTGNKIIALARNRGALEKLKRECNRGNVYIVAIDLADRNMKKKLIPFIQKQFKFIDILINNAGAIVNKPIQSTSDKELENVYNVNVLSVYRLIRDLIPLLKRQKRGSHIVNISSMGGVQGSVKFSGLSAYSSSKGAVAVLTECLAQELKQFNISVNCLALGSVQTEMLQKAFPGYKAPLSAIQMADFVANFALAGNQHFNGKILPVSISTP
ncbi:MAG: SDR family oxidoreductase [Bacteroidia bacterium]|nr:SDR family oxidoreductase [Bacteroidia bacterium]